MPAGIRRHTLTNKKRKIFLASLAEGKTVTAAARDAEYNRRYMYQAWDENPELAAEWDGAVQEGLDLLETEVRRRAVGYEEDLVYQGKKTKEQVTRHSDILLMFLLKAKRNEFRDNNKIEVNTGDRLNELLDAVAGKNEPEPADEPEAPVSE
jgi:hypothetical protein